jgi:hypothetical protein
MDIRAQIISRIEAFLQAEKMSAASFGRAVVGDHKFLRRLRTGAGVTLTNIEKAEAFMRERDEAAAMKTKADVNPAQRAA